MMKRLFLFAFVLIFLSAAYGQVSENPPGHILIEAENYVQNLTNPTYYPRMAWRQGNYVSGTIANI